MTIYDKIYKEAIELTKKVYKNNECGGALHIVIDDGNVEDRNILWCLQYSIPNPKHCAKEYRDLYEKCAIALLKLHTEQRRLNAISKAWKEYRQENPIEYPIEYNEESGVIKI